MTAGAGCAWTASTTPGSWDWVGISSGASGTGNGTVTYFVLPNNTGSPTDRDLDHRRSDLYDHSTAGCSYSISPASNTVRGGGGTGSVSVTAGAGCAWTASTTPGSWDWVGIAPGQVEPAMGPSTILCCPTIRVAHRTGTLTIAGQTFTITQQAGCTYSISPASNTLSAGARFRECERDGWGRVRVDASTNAGSWDWVGISSGWSGTGNGTVNYFVLPNNTGKTDQGR